MPSLCAPRKEMRPMTSRRKLFQLLGAASTAAAAVKPQQQPVALTDPYRRRRAVIKGGAPNTCEMKDEMELEDARPKVTFIAAYDSEGHKLMDIPIFL